MLLEISIKNFAIIEEISLNFESGMTVLTGETGAGKSIIIDAMNMMLGSRASTEIIRHGASKAEIEGYFSVEKNQLLKAILSQNGIDYEDDVIIRREIFQNGRSVSRINGQMVNLSVLRQVGQYLVDIHGQHDQEALMKASQHLYLLDAFGDKEFDKIKKRYQDTFQAYKSLRKSVIDQQTNEQEHKARLEVIGYQLAEIEAANLKSGEDILLLKQRDKLLNHKHIADTLKNALLVLDNEEFSSLSNVRSSMNDMLSIESYDTSYKEIANALSDSYYVLEDVVKQLDDLVDNLDFDESLLYEIESRLDIIATVTRKYGRSVDEVLAYQEQIDKEYHLFSGSQTRSTEDEKKLKELEFELVQIANTLSQARHSLAIKLEQDIKQELKDLYMEKADFKVQFTKGKFNKKGNEVVEFYISTNPGEDFKPLVKIASGGELSRLMLAIKAAFSQREDKTSIVFDEVDTGVSGRVAQSIAQKIHKIGQNAQVLAISHLPQVIAIADYQYFIEKRSDDNKTVSTVRLLTEIERINEIAKMLAGNDLTESAITQAKLLLSNK
ncbi:MAG: DNA repair protein RecN [Streptococcus sp.]|nr:DNA repair protein RecN [Streptococcus sp.]